MIRLELSTFAVGSVLWMTSGSPLEKPHINKIEQNTSTVEWATVNRVTIAQKSSRKVRLTGPWIDYVTSATTHNGVSARNIAKSADKELTLILDAAATSMRGPMILNLNITCPSGFWGGVGAALGFADCSSPIALPVEIFETGPINTIAPSGNVPPNTQINFDLTGDALGVAKLLPRLLSLKNASIISRTATTMRVRGTTPSCGYIDVALTDENSDGEFPYRKGGGLAAVLAGHICDNALARPPMTIIYCPPPTHWDENSKACITEE